MRTLLTLSSIHSSQRFTIAGKTFFFQNRDVDYTEEKAVFRIWFRHCFRFECNIHQKIKNRIRKVLCLNPCDANFV